MSGVKREFYVCFLDLGDAHDRAMPGGNEKNNYNYSLLAISGIPFAEPKASKLGIYAQFRLFNLVL